MMPLIVKEYTWRQTQDTVYVSVTVNSLKAQKSSFVTGDNYIRLHCHPHYFEVFLWGRVKDEKGRCTVMEGENLALFELPKDDILDWPTLELDVQSLSSSDKHAIRARAVELNQKRVADELKARLAQREANKQMTIHEQLRLDAEARERVTCIRSFQSKQAMDVFGQWKTEVKAEPGVGAIGGLKSDRSKLSKAYELNPNRLDGISWHCNSANDGKPNFMTRSDGNDPALDRSIWKDNEMEDREDSSQEPGIRKSFKLTVGFTPREFPTPSRESTAAQEEGWLKKQAEARKNCGFNYDDLRPEEHDPVWLYEKGESLMHGGSHIGAVSAFSTGIKMAPKIGELYVGRAKAHLALNNVRKAVEDASQALELLTPEVAQNFKERMECYQVRAEAFRKFNMNQDAMADLKAALSLDPENVKLKSLLEVVAEAAENFKGSSDED